MPKKIVMQTPTSYNKLSILEGLIAAQISYLQKQMVQNQQFTEKECSMLSDVIKMQQTIMEMRGELKKKAILADLTPEEQQRLVNEAIATLNKEK